MTDLLDMEQLLCVDYESQVYDLDMDVLFTVIFLMDS
jgi:hypothetical protein